MKNAFVLLSIYSIISLGCGTSSHSQNAINKPEAIIERQAGEVDVYSVAIDAFQREFGSDQIFILNASTFGRVSPDNSMEKVIAFLEKRLDLKISKELIYSFREANNVNSSLPSNFDTKAPYTVITVDQLPKVEKLSGERALGGSLVEFSQIGFTEARNNSLLYISSYNSSYNGTRTAWGYYMVLAREGGNWKVIQKFPAWVS